MAEMLDGTRSSDWWLIDHLGHRWALYGGADQGEQGVSLESISGVVSSLDREMDSTVMQIGEQIVGESIPAITPTMVVNVHERLVPGAWAAWQNALPTNREGELYYHGATGVRSLHVRGTGGGGDLSTDPFQTGMVQVEVPLLGKQGVWKSAPELILPGQSRTYIDGDVAASACVVYSQAGRLQLIVDGKEWAVDLPDPSGGAVATTFLEPSQMMRTEVDGEPVPELWSTFRNRWNPFEFLPGVLVEMQVPQGAKVLFVQRYLKPWN